jgi:hypothetical protein
MRYKNILNLIIIFAVTTLIAGCQHDDNSPQTYNKNIDVPQTTQDLTETERTSAPKNETSGRIQNVNYKEQTEENSFNTQDKRMIIRTGTMSIEADSYDETEAKIKDIVKNFGGYLTNSNSKLNADGKKQGSITIRVATEKFDAMISELSKTGKVMNQNITGMDVTEEYMDTDARLKTQRKLESRLLKLLEEKTARLTDVVEVEQKLANVRENIEKTEGRMKYLKDQASYSTLTVSVYEPSLLNTSSGGGFFYELGQGVKKGLSGFTSVLAGLITVVIALLPLIIIALIIIYLVMRYLKKRKLAKAQA